ncbi:hypothetical protein FSP39_000424 [Pinctada imbricata]|uniref:Uncharacterized protein n=1 Tax=Pinctada imbricata TaxID=66713 RepID=A0AA89C9G3_PINIB|nr:hypothetical protein FSP39_000424 [Pinctada imbricata]
MSDRTYPHSQTPQTNTCSNTLPSSRYITSAASSHGTIRTDNQQLLSLLRDNSQDRIQEPTQKAEASGAVVNPNDSNRNLTNPSNPVVTDRDSQDPTQNQYDHHGNQENVAPENTAPSGYHAHSYRDFSPTNPYPKIPPIPITEDELERQIADMEGDGYAAMYRREKEKPKDAVPWYKIYNLQDYKRMQLEARLTRGPLGPDLDNETYKEKAIDYSRNVPKPVVKPRPNQYNSYDVAAQLSPVSKPNKSAPTTTSQSPAQTVDVIDIQKLQQRHEQEKQNVAMIRQNMETVPQKA